MKNLLTIALLIGLGGVPNAKALDTTLPVSVITRGSTFTLKRDFTIPAYVSSIYISGDSFSAVVPEDTIHCGFHLRNKASVNRVLKAGRVITVSTSERVWRNGSDWSEVHFGGDKSVYSITCDSFNDGPMTIQQLQDYVLRDLFHFQMNETPEEA